ncbi:MAG: cytochrome c oxidase assembly protein [Ectothiorhodospiraceae bacterium]|nr:cytochrome c oxidase assembly protein [Chromatiales bacterium]MCP5156494.1 cytochrome c oxidase assembly protein [Ectothiorhodospiraceae bacterium]
MSGDASNTGRRTDNRRSALRLAAVALAMFGFGWALIPLYDVICEITGLDGRTGVAQAASLPTQFDADRTVTVQFVANVNSALSWDFAPAVISMQVHPGKLYDTHYLARNRTAAAIVGRAVPNVAPNVAARYFNKTECFCFSEQSLAAGEQREMPVRFVVSRDLPPEVKVLTLSYTFYRAPENG